MTFLLVYDYGISRNEELDFHLKGEYNGFLSLPDMITVNIKRLDWFCRAESINNTINVNVDMISSVQNVLKALSHELVHVSQFFIGDLKIYKCCNSWKGRIVNHPKIVTLGQYSNFPWEMQARDLSKRVYKEYFNYGKRN